MADSMDTFVGKQVPDLSTRYVLGRGSLEGEDSADTRDVLPQITQQGIEFVRFTSSVTHVVSVRHQVD